MSSEEKEYFFISKVVTLDEIPIWKTIASENRFKASPEEKKRCKTFERNEEEKRNGNSEFVTLDQIPTWKDITIEYKKCDKLNEKVSIFVGDITSLGIDAIVNATDGAMSGSGGVDRAIHTAAGKSLFYECRTLGRLPIGEAKITDGYKLPAKYVIHTAGAMGRNSKHLEECYINCLTVAQEFGLQSIAFPCISTGTFGYPQSDAAHVALRTVRNFLEMNESSINRIIFCLFLPIDVKIYVALMRKYFPV